MWSQLLKWNQHLLDHYTPDHQGDNHPSPRSKYSYQARLQLEASRSRDASSTTTARVIRGLLLSCASFCFKRQQVSGWLTCVLNALSAARSLCNKIELFRVFLQLHSVTPMHRIGMQNIFVCQTTCTEMHILVSMLLPRFRTCNNNKN